MENALLQKPGHKWPEAPLHLIDAQRLVGCFLWNYAALEMHLDTGIRRILRVEVLTMSMLSVHLTVQAKIQMLRCAVALFSVETEQWAKDAKKLFNQIDAIAKERNIIAHTVFGITDDKEAVNFHRIKATGTLSMPETKWTPNDFSTAVMTMSSMMTELRALTERIVERRSGAAKRGKPQTNYLQKLIDIGLTATTNEKPLTLAEVLADRAKALAKLGGEEEAPAPAAE